MSRDKYCETCRYYDQLYGECHRDPPGQEGFPEVDMLEDWCGEWKPQP